MIQLECKHCPSWIKESRKSSTGFVHEDNCVGCYAYSKTKAEPKYRFNYGGLQVKIRVYPIRSKKKVPVICPHCKRKTTDPVQHVRMDLEPCGRKFKNIS